MDCGQAFIQDAAVLFSASIKAVLSGVASFFPPALR